MLYYAEFTTTPANFLADLNTQMANATDWARPNSGTRPYTWKCTTTRGADMVVDFNGSAPTTSVLTFQPYYSYDGTTLGTAGPTRYIRFAVNGNGTTATHVLHVTLSASKDHLYVDVEGARWNETGTDNGSSGSPRRCFGMFDLFPYQASGVDPNPAIILVGHTANNPNDNSGSAWYKAWVNKSIGGSLWVPGYLKTLTVPGQTMDGAQPIGPDGNITLAPYVYVDDIDGLRGRLSNCFFAGWNYPAIDWLGITLAPNSFVTYSSVKYKLKAPYKSTTLTNTVVGGPFGWAQSNNNAVEPQVNYSPLIALPTP